MFSLNLRKIYRGVNFLSRFSRKLSIYWAADRAREPISCRCGCFWRQKVPILGYQPQSGQSWPFRNRLGLFFASGQSGTISLHSYFPELSKPVYSNRIQTILDQTDPSLRPSFRYPCIMENIRWIQNLEMWKILIQLFETAFWNFHFARSRSIFIRF